MKRVAMLLLVALAAAWPTVASAVGRGQADDTRQASDAQRSVCGFVFDDDIEGRVIVFDSRHRLVIELDKTGGRSVRVGVDPGIYDVQVDRDGVRESILIQVRTGEWPTIDRRRLAGRAAAPSRAGDLPPAARPPRPAEEGRLDERRPPAMPIAVASPSVDAGHRIELRLGLWRAPSFHYSQTEPEEYTGWADFACGLEYLRYISSDIGVGVAVTGQARAEGTSVDGDDSRDWGRGHATVAVPFVVRWNFVRRLTDRHEIEPYVTGGIGPVFRGDWSSTSDTHNIETSAETSTGLGGRLGVGFDAHIGRIFTLGAAAAWRWSDRPDSVTGYGSRDRGGEVMFTMGWTWGRAARLGR